MPPPPPDGTAYPSDAALLNKNNLTGILWMVLATLCLSSMHITIHFVSETVHPFISVFFRLLFALAVMVPFFVRQGWAPLKTKRPGMLILRGVLNFTAMMGFFTALSLSPVADVTSLSFTAPLFATLLAVVLLGERLGWRRASAIGAGFVGTLIVLRPGFSEISLGYALVMMSSVFWGACVIIIKNLSKTESSVTITTYMSLVMAPLALGPALHVWVTPTLAEFMWLGLLGLLGGCGQLCMAQSLKYAETHVAMPFDYLRLLWVSAMGFVFFGDVPDIFVWLGGSLIFASTAYITIRERQKRNQVSLKKT